MEKQSYKINVKGTYKLDLYECSEYQDKKIPALTAKNIDFIEGVINLDSNYNKDSDPNMGPDSSQNLKYGFEGLTSKYVGSIAYWFKAMAQGSKDFRECLRSVIVAIDRTNSTHLEASENGREKMFEIIASKCNDVVDLIRELGKVNEDGTIDEDNLIIEMSKEIPAIVKDKSKTKMRRNLSFASKFFSYADLNLNKRARYSKYDTVVSNHLEYYVKILLNDSEFKKTDIKLSDGSKEKKVIDVYNTYAKYIGCIIEKAKQEDSSNKLDRNTFDHLVWYGFK